MKKIILTIMLAPLLTHAQDSTTPKKSKSTEWFRTEVVTTGKLDTLLNEKIVSEDKLKPLDITFVGSGNIQKSFEKGDELPATTGLGVSAIKYFPHLSNKTFAGFYRVDIEATINIASTLDTLSSASTIQSNGDIRASDMSLFGNSILTPLNAGEAASLDIRAYNRKSYLGFISGFRVYNVSSNRNWQVGDTLIQATTNMFRLGAFHEFVDFENRDDYSITLGIAWAYNSVRGDVGLDSNSELRKVFLGTDQYKFSGMEFQMGLRLKNIRADFAYVRFNKNLADVPGLTGNRLVTTIRFVGGFGLELKDK